MQMIDHCYKKLEIIFTANIVNRCYIVPIPFLKTFTLLCLFLFAFLSLSSLFFITVLCGLYFARLPRIKTSQSSPEEARLSKH